MTLIAVLTDIHGNLPALEAVIADAEAQGCAGFANLGDSLSGPLWPAETADLLIARDWPTIAGNHERQLLTFERRHMGTSDRFAHDALNDRHRAWLKSLPPTLALSPDLLLCHGTPTDDLDHLLFTVADGALRDAADDEVTGRAGDEAAGTILCGHSHVPRIVRLADGRTVANPGSVGLQAFDDDHPAPYRVEVGDPRARYAIIDGDDIRLRAVDYDAGAAARRAEANGEPGWAAGLRHGRLS